MKRKPIEVMAAAAQGEPTRMNLMGDVGWEITPEGVSQALSGLKGEPIEVRINSYGGDALGGIAIYNLLSKYPGKKRCYVAGIAASAASLIAMAGDEIEIPENAFLMIHEAWGGSYGNADDMRQQADVLQAISEAYRGTYAKRTGLDVEVIGQLMKAETWMNGEEAMAAGFCTSVGKAVEAEAMASVGPVPADRFQRVPAQAMAIFGGVAAPAAPPAPEPDPEPQFQAAAPDPDPAVGDAVGSLTQTTTDELIPMPAEIDNAAEEARQAERDRQAKIRGMLQQAVINGRIGSDDAQSLATKLCDEGVELEAARAQVLEIVMGSKPGQASAGLNDHGAGNVGMSQREIESYSVLNVVRYLADPSMENRERIGLELEAHRAAESVPGQKPSDGGILIPMDVLRTRIRGGWGGMRPRAAGQEVGDFGKGGALVDTQYLVGSFIEEVYNRSSIMRTGMTMLTGLVGNVSIGKQLSGSSTYWVGENEDVTESELGFGLTNLTAHTIGVRVPFSRLSLKQTTPDVEMLARRDMTTKMALGIDKSFLYGTGSEFQPLGLSNHAGLAGVTLADGLDQVYPAHLGGGTHDSGSWANYVQLETLISGENLDEGTMVHLMNSYTRGGCKSTLRAAAAGSDYVMTDSGQINGYGTIISNQIQTNDVFFGNFADALGGMWGAVDMIVDPYTKSASGQVVVTMFQDVDFAVRYIESFAKAS